MRDVLSMDVNLQVLGLSIVILGINILNNYSIWQWWEYISYISLFILSMKGHLAERLHFLLLMIERIKHEWVFMFFDLFHDLLKLGYPMFLSERWHLLMVLRLLLLLFEWYFPWKLVSLVHEWLSVTVLYDDLVLMQLIINHWVRFSKP
jgi:hypothetical protein